MGNSILPQRAFVRQVVAQLAAERPALYQRLNGRIQAAVELVAAGAVRPSGKAFLVSAGKGRQRDNWIVQDRQCDCPDYRYRSSRGITCKHCIAVWLALQAAAAEREAMLDLAAAREEEPCFDPHQEHGRWIGPNEHRCPDGFANTLDIRGYNGGRYCGRCEAPYCTACDALVWR